MIDMVKAPADTRYLLVHVSGGLGNRLRAMLSALHLSRRTDRRLIVHWVPKHNCKADFRHLFSSATTEWLCVFGRDPENRAWNIAARGGFCTPEQAESDVPRVLMRTNKTIGSKNIPWAALFGELELSDDVKGFLEQVEKAAPLANYTGIHVRRGDHEAACAIPLKAYFDAADKVEGMLLLATDERSVEGQFRERYGTRVEMIQKRSRKRYKHEAIQDALVDMLALSRCKHLIGAGVSSFVQMASRIGSVPFTDVGKEETA